MAIEKVTSRETAKVIFVTVETTETTLYGIKYFKNSGDIATPKQTDYRTGEQTKWNQFTITPTVKKAIMDHVAELSA
jgi:hypothetical protein